MPITQTFTHFYCLGPKPTAGTTDVFTVDSNGSATAATCAIPTGGTTSRRLRRFFPVSI